jgi:hypothetical protein
VTLGGGTLSRGDDHGLTATNDSSHAAVGTKEKSMPKASMRKPASKAMDKAAPAKRSKAALKTRAASPSRSRASKTK